MELVLVRHAQSIWNAEDRWQGQSDVPLSEVGRAEAQKIGARLGGERFDRIVSSDLGRALDTARAIAGARPIDPWPELREMNLGAWCGLPHAEVASRFPAELEALQRGTPMRLGGHGETLDEFGARVLGALGRLEAEGGERVLVVAHGGVIRAVLFALLGLSGRRRPLVGSGNTGITTLRGIGEARTLVAYNDQAHLGLFAEDGDVVEPDDRARAEVLSALSLEPTSKLAAAAPGTRTVVHHGRGGAQLRRYAVPPVDAVDAR